MTLTADALPPSFTARLSSTAPDECWTWTGCGNGHGYGLFGSGKRSKNVYVHRFAYEQIVGPIPAGLEIDHLCFNRGCCNPAHMEPVTHAVNMHRGWARRRLAAAT